MAGISASVGRGGRNIPSDVGTVQTLLNRHTAALGLAALKVDNSAGPKTIEAIEAFQRQVVKLSQPDGRVDVGGRTFAALAAASPGNGNGSANLSGAIWWHANQARFPNSHSINDLASPFRENVQSFVNALTAGGASVSIGSTLRNKKRAYLMHYSWDIAKGLIDPAQVPVEPGVDITWNHGQLAASKAAAQAMMDLFDLAHRPSLTSLHISGLAIDMDITWSGTLNVRNKNGNSVAIGSPRDGASNTALHSIGATYGVKKLASDPPHWSSTGH
jgi:peptidoglycan hydrolase-like protein with peptidoglycan-binding domain